MEPLSLAVGVVAAATGAATGLRLRHRLRRAEATLAGLHRDLQAERHAANHDPLTGLPNRRAFFQLGAELVNDPVRPAIACVVVDLNCFKQINDSLGHAAGDEVLVTFAGRLASYAGGDLVARLGGDEFAGLFTNPTTGWRLLYPAADDLAAVLAAPIWVAGRSLQISAAVGAAPVDRATGLASALHQADCAMYRAKTTGTGVACFTPTLDDATVVMPGGTRSPAGGGPAAPYAPYEPYRGGRGDGWGGGPAARTDGDRAAVATALMPRHAHPTTARLPRDPHPAPTARSPVRASRRVEAAG